MKRLVDLITVFALVVGVLLAARPQSAFRLLLGRQSAERQLIRTVEEVWDELDAVAPTMANQPLGTDVLLVSDYSCVHCRRAIPLLDSAVADGIRVRVLQMPRNGSSLSVASARIGVCSYSVSNFARVHRSLFELAGHDPATLEDSLSDFVPPEELAEVRVCVASPMGDSLLRRHDELAKRLRISATPTFVLPTRRLVGVPSLAELHAAKKGAPRRSSEALR